MAKTTPAILCAIALAACAMAQRPAASPAKAGDNKELAATLKLIQDKINEQGEIHYTVISENLSKGIKIENKYAMQTGKAVVDVSACTLSVEAHMSKDGKLQTRGRDTVNVRNVTAMTVKSQTRMIREKTARMGVTGWKGTIVPESYSLELMSRGRISGVFFFRTQESANQVADAVVRATKLCGGISMMP
ncbi:MAG TPA: hypothetical protein VKV30_07380 [Candidatus Angelobacter sp.]|nr:hypothetical protein [Candidatus Angelobacter sp.]